MCLIQNLQYFFARQVKKLKADTTSLKNKLRISFVWRDDLENHEKMEYMLPMRKNNLRNKKTSTPRLNQTRSKTVQWTKI